MFSLIRSVLFLMSPEKAHYFTMNTLSFMLKLPFVGASFRSKVQKVPFKNPRIVAGLNFHNPVGIGAGFDKNARYINELFLLGFGYVEIGTVTPKPQEGNSKPRLFRLKKDKALINRMGFNNDGVDAIVKRLKNRDAKIVVGGNIGKNKETPNENAVDDYIICFDKLHPYVDYFVVNVSSPNTPGLRELQDRDSLTKILGALESRNQKLQIPRPIFLKIAPDLSWDQIDEVVQIVQENAIAGLIVNNTTISREGLQTSKVEIEKIGNGGLSGAPLQIKSRAVLQRVLDRKTKDFAVISVGGIMTGEEGQTRLNQGADLIQIWTGFIYKGPSLIKSILRRI